MDSFKTIAEVMRYVKANYSSDNSLNYQTIGGGEWIQYSSQELVDQVKYLALGLKELGVTKGMMIGLLANSSPKWTIVDLAIMVAGGVSIPLFANISEENFDFEIQQTNLKYIFVSGRDQWQRLSNNQSQFTHVIALFGESDFANFSYDDLIIRGKKIESENSDAYQNLLNANQPKDLATIVFTSGSTGIPKGVMLTHENITSLLHLNPFNWKSGKDTYLSILPLAHIFARTLNLIMISWGIPVYYVRHLSQFGDLCRSLHPSILVVVPRILEKVYDVMCAKVESSEILKRAIGHWAFDLANNEGDSLYKRMVHPIADKIVYSALRDALGGNLRIVISGGAPLNPHLYHFFCDIGVPLFEGWGLTEAAAISSNRINNYKIGSVGLPFDGIQVKVSSENELLVKGALVMQGYYKNEEATNNAFTVDGWLKTGDRGKIDENGFITIEGRLKELYKTSTGEYIAPVPIEQKLCKAPLIDMAMLVVEKRKFASCLIFPNLEVLKKLKIAANQGQLSDEEFVNGDFIKNQMDQLFNELNMHLNHWEQIHGYKFILTPPTIEGGELTPTMKLKRQAVIQKYNKLIDKIYTGEAT